MQDADRPLKLGGYVLAGGRSTRMGSDKAKVCLGGKPLIAHAVEKLSGICDEVRILSGDPELARYGELVRDLHPGCGPVGGMEAALVSSGADWLLFVPVDVPLLPFELLARWVRDVLGRTASGVRMSGFVVDGELEPAVLLLHRDAAAGIAECVADNRLKIAVALEWTAEKLAHALGVRSGDVFWRVELLDTESARWFSNLNTPEELAEADAYLSSRGVPDGTGFGHH